MSLEENTNDTENSSPAEEPNQPASIAEPAAAPVEAGAANALATILALKESNPKVFYGGVGGVALLLLLMIFSGGSNPKLPVHQQKPLVVGQSYVLKSPNTYDPNATVRLVGVPGSLAAYDDTEENDRDGACKHMPMNSPVKLLQIQNDTTDKNLVWAEVEITASGECQGRRAWTSGINLQ
ncbi:MULTISPECIES: hypothetical protein [Methylomonas]|uniref:Uncharacterized protein n=1 Tax=Methylomonas koyamae TaxID=702114 RepID=A0A177NM05_9GAMM|nr:hypothetical protein [Methylomonas koyamae]OAI18423.1 hypothetical protein A1355_05890 [Methylomonas koyamae]